jgi:uncharacterized protein (DUF433 family)
MATAEYAHVTVGPDEVPVITGTHIKVVEIVLDHLAHGSDAREIQRQHPHLSPGQIHAALGYYYDHQTEMDADIADRLRKVERLRAELSQLQGESTVRLKLKALGLLS